MARIPVWILTLVMLLVGASFSSFPQNSSNTASPSQQNSPSAGSAAPATDAVQQANREDLQQMQAILNQMRNNLAFVGNNTSPLNHQFELEIEMWQMLLNRMEGRPTQPAAQKPGR